MLSSRELEERECSLCNGCSQSCPINKVLDSLRIEEEIRAYRENDFELCKANDGNYCQCCERCMYE